MIFSMETTAEGNPFPVGSPQPGGSPQGGFGGAAGADVTLRMVQAAEAAAQQLLFRQTPEEPRSWWKLLPKSAVFDHSSRETEISAWREWSWSFEQYITSVDPKFGDDIQAMRSKLDQAVDPVDFSDSERQRNAFLYSML